MHPDFSSSTIVQYYVLKKVEGISRRLYSATMAAPTATRRLPTEATTLTPAPVKGTTLLLEGAVDGEAAPDA